ncbi:hypothetical protein DV515_00001774 [Chloebia gouldiae]|uniref:Uncharacterized protein n=1 Tax=Chloebia gouldiae TaxID=44316 RepID=A0A3L8SZ46_CHLGU|nr:hypothetical protein DV515_00001774 [Chloebia gouldiae]
MLDPPFGPMEEKMISEMTARQHKAEGQPLQHLTTCPSVPGFPLQPVSQDFSIHSL